MNQAERLSAKPDEIVTIAFPVDFNAASLAKLAFTKRCLWDESVKLYQVVSNAIIASASSSTNTFNRRLQVGNGSIK